MSEGGREREGRVERREGKGERGGREKERETKVDEECKGWGKRNEREREMWLLFLPFISCIVYRLYTVVPRLVRFIDQLTNWYVRFNRKRIKVSKK